MSADRPSQDPPAMSSILKTAVPLALLVGVVFAVTYFSRYTPTEPEPLTSKAAAGADGTRPLRFFTSRRAWNPKSDSLPDRAFTGFYEVGDAPQSAAFWFENKNPDPVTLQLKSVSCTSCSGGRVAAVPPEATRKLFQAAAVGGLPVGPVFGGPVGLGEAAANLFANLQWQEHAFNQDPAKVQYQVPGAAGTDPWAPQWGILDLNFRVKANPPQPLTAVFASQVKGTEVVGGDKFDIYYSPALAMTVDQDALEAAEMTADSPPQSFEVVAFTMTRPDLAKPTAVVEMPAGSAGEAGPFVTAGEPVRLTPDELERVAAGLAERVKQPVRVRAGYRIPVVVRPRADGKNADIGKLERVLFVTQGSEVRQVTVKGVVRGPVYLSGESKEIVVPTFKSSAGSPPAVYEITSEKIGIDLAVVPGECRPDYLKVELTKKPDRGDRSYFELRVSVPKDKLLGELRDGLVVLGGKGPNPLRLRVPVQARGTR